MSLSTLPRSIQCLLVSSRSSSRPSCAWPSGHCVSGSAGGAHGARRMPCMLACTGGVLIQLIP
jgi:hypothetical protein